MNRNRRVWTLWLFVSLLTATSLCGQNSTSISCPSQAAVGSSVSCSMSLSLGTSVTIDSLTFGVTVTPANGGPALTTGQLTFSASVSGAFVSTGGSNNAIAAVWSGLTPPLSGNTTLGSIGFSLPASAAGGQTYTAAISGSSASLGATSVSLSIRSEEHTSELQSLRHL